MTMRILVGHKCNLYVGALAATNDRISGLGTLYGEIKGVRVGGSGTKSDSTTRNNSGWRRNTQGLKEGDISFPALHSDVAADVAMMDVIGAYFNNGTVFGVRLLDDKGVVYMNAPMVCTEFPRDEDLGSPVTSNITFAMAGAPYIFNYIITANGLSVR